MYLLILSCPFSRVATQILPSLLCPWLRTSLQSSAQWPHFTWCQGRHIYQQALWSLFSCFTCIPFFKLVAFLFLLPTYFAPQCCRYIFTWWLLVLLSDLACTLVANFIDPTGQQATSNWYPIWWYCSIQCSIILPIPPGMFCLWFTTCMSMPCIFGVILIPISWVCTFALSVWSCVWLQWSLSDLCHGYLLIMCHLTVLIPSQHCHTFYWLYPTASLSLPQSGPLLSHEIQNNHSQFTAGTITAKNPADLSMILQMSLPWNGIWNSEICLRCASETFYLLLYTLIRLQSYSPNIHLQLCREFCNVQIQHSNLLWKYILSCI